MSSANASSKRILWFTWKDRAHPLAGGAEIVNEELAKRLVRDGHEVTFIVAGFAGAAATETRDGFKLIRLGNRFTVYWYAYRYFRRHLRGWPTLVIDEINTLPFMAAWYTATPTVLFVHQLARSVWFYEMLFPLSLVGYVMEWVYLRLLRRLSVITVSESTKRDLERFGFAAERIRIISEGIELEPVESPATVQKAERPTLLALGSIRPMKRTHHVIRAFELLKRDLPEAQLWIAGAPVGWYGCWVKWWAGKSTFKNDITWFGPVTRAQKIDLLRRAHVLCVTSVKEGWGLVVTEAASQGTPAAAYDVDGLRDSVRDGETGVVCPRNTVKEMARQIRLVINNHQRYSLAAWQWSKEIAFEQSAREFAECLGTL